MKVFPAILVKAAASGETVNLKKRQKKYGYHITSSTITAPI